MKRWISLSVLTFVSFCGFPPNASPQAVPSEKEGYDRYFSLAKLAYAAIDGRNFDKAESLARELLAERDRLEGRNPGWNDGNAVFHANAILGIVALHRDNNVARAKEALLTAGRTPGSPQLNSFGPNMTLPQELLARGERDTVLQFIDLCRVFLKSDVRRLDRWATLVRSGGTPVSDGDWKASLKFGH